MAKKDSTAVNTKKPWPTKAAMEQVYAMKLWGSNQSDFYSGIGSHDPELVVPYVQLLKSFLISFKIPLVVCDLGCGDFNVGKRIVAYSKKYIAIDIVPDLIRYNKTMFQQHNLEFHCLDIALADLPAGDCVLLRQVLQHLSNAEIQQILPKLAKFKYIILTEHLPEGHFIPNKDLISGQGIRLKKQSGVDLLAAPFNFEIKEQRQMLSMLPKDYKGVIVTTLYTLF